MEEIWKKVPDFNYEVSNLGRVRNKNKKLLVICYGRYGYGLVTFYKGRDVKKTMFVHKVVAMTFIDNPDPENLTDVNHINENPRDNRVENLEWVSHKYNCQYGNRNKNVRNTKLIKDAIKFILEREPDKLRIIKMIINFGTNVENV